MLPTDLIQKYHILLLLTILLSKKQKNVSDGLQWLSEDILGQPMVVVQDSLRQFMVVFQERQQQLSKIVNFCANLPTFASKPSYEPGSQVRVEIWTLVASLPPPLPSTLHFFVASPAHLSSTLNMTFLCCVANTTRKYLMEGTSQLILIIPILSLGRLLPIWTILTRTKNDLL